MGTKDGRLGERIALNRTEVLEYAETLLLSQQR